MRPQSTSLELFGQQRALLKRDAAHRLRRAMAALVHHRPTADLLLVSADGRKLPAHLCVLRQRAPVFFQRYVGPTLQASPRHATPQAPLEVAVGDVDSTGLSFFIKSIYTEEELADLPGQQRPDTENALLGSDAMLFRDGLSDDFPDKSARQTREGRVGRGRVGLIRGYQVSAMDLADVTNRDMSASFPSPDEIVQKAQELTASVSHLERRSPLMTSFKKLASQQSLNESGSIMFTSGCSEKEETDESRRRSRSVVSEADSQVFSKFIRLEDSQAGIGSALGSADQKKAIFPMFIGMADGADDPMTQSAPSAENFGSTIRGRAMLARRLSVSSLTSLTSIDMTPTRDSPAFFNDSQPASKLGEDLLAMYKEGADVDVTIKTRNGPIRAHRCVLWAMCAELRKLASACLSEIDLSEPSVDFLMKFLYGGLTTLPEEVNVWEMARLADYLRLDMLVQVVSLHVKTYKCHYFHRPCASCVSAVFDAIPQMSELPALRPLLEEALAWQSRHFARIWKGRVFLHLSERWQRECFEALMQSVTDESVIDVLLGCEKLQVALPRIKPQHHNGFVQKLVNDLVEYCTDFLIASLDTVVLAKAFVQQGRGLALNLALLEDVFPSLIHSLNADTAIRTYIALKQLLSDIMEGRLQSGSSSSVNQVEDISTRFVSLCRRLFELCDRHLLHYTASVIKSEAWDLLIPEDQNRIKETGIFVEMCLPKAPPPHLSSLSRAYKRSSSVGIGNGSRLDGPYLAHYERTRSLERARPISTFTQLLEADEPLEAILEREKSQTKMHVEHHRRSNSHRESSSSRLSTKSDASTVSTVKAQPIEPQKPKKTHPKTPSPTKDLNSTPGVDEEAKPLKKRQPALKKTLPEVSRQDTHTIMTAEQNRERGITAKSDQPEASSTSTDAAVSAVSKVKPRSVVKPMPKPAQTATALVKGSSTVRRLAGATASSAAKMVERNRLTQPRLPPPNAAILGRQPLASIDGKPKRKEEGSRIPRTATTRRKPVGMRSDTPHSPDPHHNLSDVSLRRAAMPATNRVSSTQMSSEDSGILPRSADFISSRHLQNRMEELEAKLDRLLDKRAETMLKIRELKLQAGQPLKMGSFTLCISASAALKMMAVVYWTFMVTRMTIHADLNLLTALFGSFALFLLCFGVISQHHFLLVPIIIASLVELATASMQTNALFTFMTSNFTMQEDTEFLQSQWGIFGSQLTDALIRSPFSVILYCTLKMIVFMTSVCFVTFLVNFYRIRGLKIVELEGTVKTLQKEIYRVSTQIELIRRT